MPTSLIFAAVRAAFLLVTIAAVPLTQVPASFTVTSISNRILTPNGDGRNDSVVFQFDNPQFSEVTGKVYDARGAFISAMQAGPVANTSLQWDGKATGRSVASGIYIYVLVMGGRQYTGAVLVAK